ncbi:MAG TPA: M14 family zinc carboxypeptidase [Mycobacteriales bacterium]|nr:M14 family zinc carboxypeptidase [Mycobacteriales bacterium]
MRRSRALAAGLAAAVVTVLATAAGSNHSTSPPGTDTSPGLAAYQVDIHDSHALRLLAQAGNDMEEGAGRDGQAEVVALPGQVHKLRAAGLTVTLKPTTAAGAGPRPDGSYQVWRPYYDRTFVGTEGGRPRETLYEELQRIAAEHPDIVKPEIIGRSLLGKPILALRITKDARKPANRDGSRPAVLYSATLHAREWLATEQARRLVHLLVDNYGHSGPAKAVGGENVAGLTGATLTRLVDTRELWFVPVANPDGYDHTFTPGNRLWRKNMRDTDGDGVVDTGDGVDLNRNFGGHWGFDNEGSSDDPSGEIYRGSAALSEPEVKAVDGLLSRIRFAFLADYHITPLGQRLLYGVGYQIHTDSPDDLISRALAGTDRKPAIGGNPPGAPDPYSPGLLAFPFRNNGILGDAAHAVHHVLPFTVEVDAANPDRGGGSSIFEFQDSEADVQQSFVKNIPFALDVALSAPDPANPVSHLGNTAPAFELHPFAVSYGDPQPVRVTVKRSLGPVRMHWRINGGREHAARTREYQGGERYGDSYNIYYHEMRGTVTGTRPGDRVTVWFTAGGKRSESFRYSIRSDSNKPVLIMAAEDYSGQPGSTLESPPYANRTRPNYLGYYTAALSANKIPFDVYNVDAERRTAPDPLGVLGHYRAVIWYTANDSLVRAVGVPGSTGTGKLAGDEILAVRDYLNDGGKVLYTGQNAALPQLLNAQYNPGGEPPYCHASASSPGTVTTCTTLTDDFLQYWLGAYSHIDAATTKAEVSALHLESTSGGARYRLNGVGSADNQEHTYSAVTTSSILPVPKFPQFASQVSVGLAGPSGFDPVTGSRYAVAESDNSGYQRLRRTVDLTGATSAELSLKLSYDVEKDYDYVIVEAHHVGQDDWTTLPDANGHTSTSVGGSCDENLDTIHPFLDHYQTNPDKRKVDCTGTGTTGVWQGATGNSRGWQDWRVDLSRYAGSQVEVAISYVQDSGVTGLGVLLDDVTVRKDGAIAEQTSFEDGLGGFTAGPAPDGSAAITDHAWTSRPTVGFAVGTGIQTPHSVYWGFGLEGIAGAGDRAQLIGQALRHLGVAR